MKRSLLMRGLFGLALAVAFQAQAFRFEYNIDKRAVDENGNPLPKMIDISTYRYNSGGYNNPHSDDFKKYLNARKNTGIAVDVIAKTGPIFGKVAGKLAGPAVNAAVVAETGSKGAGAAAGKITEQSLSILGKATARLVQSKVFGLPLYLSEQKFNAAHFLDGIKIGNAKCRDLGSMKLKKYEKLNQDSPHPVLVVVYNRTPVTATIDGQTVKTENFEILANKWFYPMGPDPQNGKFFSGPLRVAKDAKGNVITNPKTGQPAMDGARGGLFGSYSITTRYQKTPVYIEKTSVDARGNKQVTMVPVIDPKTGKQKVDIRLVADFDLMNLRGGVDCRNGGKNDYLNGDPDKPVSNDDFYPVGKFESDTTAETLASK